MKNILLAGFIFLAACAPTSKELVLKDIQKKTSEMMVKIREPLLMMGSGGQAPLESLDFLEPEILLSEKGDFAFVLIRVYQDKKVELGEHLLVFSCNAEKCELAGVMTRVKPQ